MFRLAFIMGTCAVCSLSSTLVIGQVANGDFESGDAGFTTGFAFSPGNIVAARTYDVVTDPRTVHGSATSYFDRTAGNGTGLMMAVNGSTSPNDVVWSQSVGVLPNTTYDFGVWTSTWFSPAGLSVRINDSAIAADFSTPSVNGVWEQFTSSWNSSANTTAKIEIVNVSTAFVGNDFALDDITFAAVPEPTSMALSAIAIFGLADKRRFPYSTQKLKRK